MKKLVIFAAALALSLAVWALPTVEQVRAEVNQGRFAQAESMMREVVTAKPESAKAHYLYAEILAHNKRFEQAAQEARLARQLDSDIRFTKPEEFRNFEQMLERERQAAKSAALPSTERKSTGGTGAQMSPRAAAEPASTGSGLPSWVWGLGAAAVAVMAWRMISARRAAPTTMAAPPTGYAANGVPGGGYPAGPMGGGAMPGAGSGLLGAGLAGAGGFAAGMLAEKYLGGHRDQGTGNLSANDGGLIPGSFGGANEAASDLENRSIDFGSGDDWGGGGGSDGGGGGSDDW